MMAVTVLLGNTLASSRRLDSVLDTSRLKHTMVLVNPRLWMVRMLDMVPAVPKQDQHLKGYWSTCKIIALCQDITCCARKSYLGLALDNGFVTLGWTFVESPQPSSNGSMSDPIKCWILTPSFCLRWNIVKRYIGLNVENKQQISWKSNRCRENAYLSGK